MLRPVVFFIYCWTATLSIPTGSAAEDPWVGFISPSIPSIQSHPREFPDAPTSTPESPHEVVADENENETVDDLDSTATPSTYPRDLIASSGVSRFLSSSVISAPPSPEARSPRLLC